MSRQRSLTSNDRPRDQRALAHPDSAKKRREGELVELAEEGVAVVRLTCWHSYIDGLHIWTAAGRWLDEKTGKRGRLYGTTIRGLLADERPTMLVNLGAVKKR